MPEKLFHSVLLEERDPGVASGVFDLVGYSPCGPLVLARDIGAREQCAGERLRKWWAAQVLSE